MDKKVLTGEQLKKLRQRLGWSPDQMSARLECSLETLKTLEASGSLSLEDAILTKLEHIGQVLAESSASLRGEPKADFVMNDQGFSQVEADKLSD